MTGPSTETLQDHDCGSEWEQVVLNEGDDVLVRQCQVCGKLEYESDGGRPMAWFRSTRFTQAEWSAAGHYGPPVEYAYSPEHNSPDAPRVWKAFP